MAHYYPYYGLPQRRRKNRSRTEMVVKEWASRNKLFCGFPIDFRLPGNHVGDLGIFCGDLAVNKERTGEKRSK